LTQLDDLTNLNDYEKLGNVYPDDAVVMTVSQATALKDLFPDSTIVVNDSLTNLTSDVITGYLTDNKILRVDLGTSTQTQSITTDRVSDLIRLSLQILETCTRPQPSP
jgi:hypothetical protein